MDLSKLKKIGQQQFWNKYKDLQRDTHDLKYLFWECTLNCNFFCKHCGSSAGRKFYTDELTTQEIKDVFLDVVQNFDPKTIMLAITGGEPLIREDLFEVMSYAHELGFSWGMVTNGFLVDGEIVKKMKASSMSTVVVSIDGLGEMHDKFRNRSGAYEKAVNAVKLMADAKFLYDLQITTMVYPENFNDLEKMYDEFFKLGINSWRLSNVDPIGRGEQDTSISLNDQQLRGLLEFIKAKRKLDPAKVVTYGCTGYLGLDFEGDVRDHYFVCSTGINIGSILHNGDIFVCPNVPRMPELIQGNVRTEKFSDVWKNKFTLFRNKNRNACEKCLNCKNWKECLGGSYHLWDPVKKEPKFCHVERLYGSK
jgi:radical SAM protein with 4Fe4S-binding SPASM domain